MKKSEWVPCYVCDGSGRLTYEGSVLGGECTVCKGKRVVEVAMVGDDENPFVESPEEAAAMEAESRARQLDELKRIFFEIRPTAPRDVSVFELYGDELLEFSRRVVAEVKSLRGVDYWGTLYGMAADMEQPVYRRPVAGWLSHGASVVVCDDGAVFIFKREDDFDWRERPPIPGTQRAAEIGPTEPALPAMEKKNA